MTTPDDREWQALNAYVDGELSAAERARIARAIADRPDLARQVSVLTALKHAAGEALAPDEDHGGNGMPDPPVNGRRLPRPLLAVAGVVLLAIIATSGWLLVQMLVPAGGDRLTRAWAVHDRLAAAAPAESRELALRLVASQAALRIDVLPADLSAARLTVGAVERLHDADGRALLAIGYRGTRGCRLTLLIRTGTQGPDAAALGRLSGPPDNAYAWRVGGLDYLLLARGMAEARLFLIAKSLHRASVERAQFDAQTRLALQQSRKTSPPCQRA